MLERCAYEGASGELLSASFLDYAMPRADHFPSFDVELTEHPTKGNALRVKGGGEAGITASPAALINAVIDALGDFAIEHLDMPATPERVWAAMRKIDVRWYSSPTKIAVPGSAIWIAASNFGTRDRKLVRRLDLALRMMAPIENETRSC